MTFFMLVALVQSVARFVYSVAVFAVTIITLVLFSLIIGLVAGINILITRQPVLLNNLQIAWHAIIKYGRAAAGSATIVHRDGMADPRFHVLRPTIMSAAHGSSENLFDVAQAVYALLGPYGWVFKEEMGKWYYAWLTWPLRMIGGVTVINRADREGSVQSLGGIRMGATGVWTSFIDGTRASEDSFHASLRVIAKLFEQGYLPLSALREWDLTLRTPRYEGLLAMMAANPDTNDMLAFSTYRPVPKNSSMIWQTLLMATKPFDAHAWLVYWNRRDLGWHPDGAFDRTLFGAGLIQLWLHEVLPRLRAHGVTTAYDLGYRAPSDLVRKYPHVWNEDGTVKPVASISVSPYGGSDVDEANYALVETADHAAVQAGFARFTARVDLNRPPDETDDTHGPKCGCSDCCDYHWS